MGWKSHKLYYETSKWNILWLTSTKLELYVHINIKYMCTYVCIIWVWKEICLFYFISFFFLLFLPPYSSSFPLLTRHIHSSELSVINYFVLFHSIPSFLILYTFYYCYYYDLCRCFASCFTSYLWLFSFCSHSLLFMLFMFLSSCAEFFFSLQFRLNFWKNWITAVMLDSLCLFAYFKYSFFCGCSFNIVIVIVNNFSWTLQLGGSGMRVCDVKDVYGKVNMSIVNDNVVWGFWDLYEMVELRVFCVNL